MNYDSRNRISTFQDLTRYFLIKTRGNKKSYISIGYSKGIEAGFSFVILNGVRSTYDDMRKFIYNRERAGYEIYDSRENRIYLPELLAFANNARYHNRGCFETKFRDRDGYSFCEKLPKRPRT